MAAVEFYRKGGGLLVAVDDESAVPRKDEYVSIERKTWKVAAVTWAVDQSGLNPAKLRANVELIETT